MDKLTGTEKFIRFKKVRDALKPLVRKAQQSKYAYIKVRVSDIISLDETIKTTMGSYTQWQEKEETDG